MKSTKMNVAAPPPRWQNPSWVIWLGVALFLIFFGHGLLISQLTPERFVRGFFRLGSFLSQAFPPQVTRLDSILRAALETFEMALVGTVAGALLSLPLALLAAHNTSPHPFLEGVSRSFIAFMRAVPDLVWGLLFVVVVGLGPGPGILAITVDVIGFCGKFFAERIEELDPGPIEALRVLGASEMAVIAGAVIPGAIPSFIASTLYALEKSIRAAVVLGLVGAGGIGVELATSMQLLRYSEALTIILVIFAAVIVVERISGAIRRVTI